ncbi:nitrate reductase molybdenum cofactor assembly chaperone [Entomobacter blattae]|uniref:Nitrate reductase delta subunit n=1 Tax=Entomobacter blattae TaxID=2762277 RepID=A0A7H1NQX1_9PROT|nr:nitrate reductase molybdenum cofactor assembly chaperone [Entomobacter blattae]QNT78181.1 Nitrate reductase delta subunit [Entomobacter blattae]
MSHKQPSPSPSLAHPPEEGGDNPTKMHIPQPGTTKPQGVTFRVLSILLSYPTKGMQAAQEEMIAAIENEQLLSASSQQKITALIKQMANTNLYDLQEQYVELFDRSRELSLHLFEHIHGESKSRGQAMVSLSQLYEQYEVFNVTNELPDYLPLFLEFLSIAPQEKVKTTLVEPLAIFKALTERLEKRDSPYAVVLAALTELAQNYADQLTQAVKTQAVKTQTVKIPTVKTPIVKTQGAKTSTAKIQAANKAKPA